MSLSSSGSANVSLDLITSSSYDLSLWHSSIYVLSSISTSCDFVVFTLLFIRSSSSVFTVTRFLSSLILRFRFTVRWLSSFLSLVKLPPTTGPLPRGAAVISGFVSSSSISLSFFYSSTSIICRRVRNFILSSLNWLAASFCFKLSSYNYSLSWFTTLGRNLFASISMALGFLIAGAAVHCFYGYYKLFQLAVVGLFIFPLDMFERVCCCIY